MKTRRSFWTTLLAGFAALCFWKKAPEIARDGVRSLVVKRRDWCTTEMLLNPEWVKAGPEADIHFCWNADAFKEFRKDT